MDFNYTLIGQLLAFILFVWFCMRFIWPQLLDILETREKENKQKKDKLPKDLLNIKPIKPGSRNI